MKNKIFTFLLIAVIALILATCGQTFSDTDKDITVIEQTFEISQASTDFLY